MGKKLLTVFLTVMIACSAMFGCSRASDISSGPVDKDYPIVIGDVTIRQEPAGVAVLSPNIASIILSIGYEISLKARSEDCVQSDLSVLPVVTADDAQKIRELGADVVFADSLTDEQKSAMQEQGLTVLTLEPAVNREELEQLYANVGSVLKGGRTGYQKGKDVADGILQTIDDITRVVPESEIPVTAVYLYDADGHAATGDTFADDLIEAAGLVNSAAGGTNGTIEISDLLLADPQYIFCAKGVQSELESSEEYSKLTAVQEHRVYEMDEQLMTCQGDELIRAVSFMAGTVHPELLGETSSSEPSSSSASSSQAEAEINLDQTLQSGMQNDDVLKLQERLEELGYMFVEPTGLYAEATVQSVKDFQYLNGMTVTGVADPDTLKKIFSPDAIKRTDQTDQ